MDNHEFYVPAHMAKTLAEAGFNWGCRRFCTFRNGKLVEVKDYQNALGEYVTNDDLKGYDTYYETNYAVPTVQMALQWLVEAFGIFIKIGCDTDESHTFYFSLYKKGDVCWGEIFPPAVNTYVGFSSIEKCAIAAIAYVFKNVIADDKR